MELLILLLLILLNGVFSTSEAAIIAARKARLQQLADKGDQGAETALKLAQEPLRFLSTIQVGITLIGIVTGAVGGASISAQIAALLVTTPLAPYADALAFTLVVAVTTYLSLILGELVPKQLALRFPEQISASVARPMNLLTRLTSPLISFLTFSSNAIVFLLGVRASEEPPVTEEEIKTMMQQGIEAGVFEEVEQDMVSGIFRLGDRRVGSIMTPRVEVYWLNLRDTEDENRTKIKDSIFSLITVCDGDMDHVVGVLDTKKMLSRLLAGEQFDIEAAMDKPQFVPQSMSASKVLDLFRTSEQHLAIVIDEYGGME
ncbi:MAG TPA: hemolysin family protein, partial [Phototrophicaceae bacterium]|nr:hemolysin family protein [Phototrophicaceae bacterium]